MAVASVPALVVATQLTGLVKKSPVRVTVVAAAKFLPKALGPIVTVAVHDVTTEAGAAAKAEMSLVGLTTVGDEAPNAVVADAWLVTVGQVPPVSLYD